ncbi:MAG: branched-chain amino acid transporter AzlC [Erysipelothrix sp.]|nr:branched-chain amino acid transporter AzlC [Erysipelothrix sp.]
MLLRQAGYGLVWALAMSLFIYAGSMQYVGISLISAPATLLTTLLTTLVVNARHLFYSISMIKKYDKAGKFKPYLIFSLTDETYALIASDDSKQASDYLHFFIVSFLNHIYWILGTIAGSMFAKAISFNVLGLEFSMTALFLAAFVDQWLDGKHRIVATLGILLTLTSRLIFGTKVFLIPAMIAITIILVIFKDKLGEVSVK